MKDLLAQILGIARGIWPFRWHAMGIAWLVALGGWAAIYILITPSYQATAQIYANTETVLRPLMEGLALDVDFNKQLNLMARRVMSRPNLESVVAQTGLDQIEGKERPMAEAVDQLRENLSLSAERPKGQDVAVTNVYDLTYSNRDPVIAKQVVESLIQAFTKSTLEEIRTESERGKRFIEQQLQEQAKVAAAAAEKVRLFRQQNLDVLSGEGRSYFDRLHAAEAAVADVEREINEALSRRLSLQDELDRTPAHVRAVGVDGSLIPTPAEARLTELKEELARLRLKYTEAHPDVIATEDSIFQVQAEIRSGNNPGPTVPNPTYQQLELRVREVAGDLAALHARKEALLHQRDELAKEVSTLPAIEDELTELTRDADNAAGQLKALEERRRSMEISDNVDQTSLDLYFRVIEPPRVAAAAVLADVWKKKILMSGAVFVVALGAGVGLAYLLFQYRSPVLTQLELHNLTGLPLFGVISRFPTSAAQIRERFDRTALALSAVLLVVLFALSLLAQKKSLYGIASQDVSPEMTIEDQS